MAINKAMYNGVQDIMNAYDRNADTPFYSVWAGRDMIFSFNENDSEKGRNHLMENLLACEQNDHTDILRIKFHPKQEKLFITDKTPAIATLFVRVCEVNPNKGQYYPMPQNFPQNNQIAELLQKQNEIISGLHNRLELIEAGDEDEDPAEPQTETEAILGKIDGILNNPILNILIGFLNPKIADLLKQPNNNPVTALAGINKGVGSTEEQTEILQMALIRLNEHVKNLPLIMTKLADYADKNNAQFNMLIKML